MGEEEKKKTETRSNAKVGFQWENLNKNWVEGSKLVAGEEQLAKDNSTEDT